MRTVVAICGAASGSWQFRQSFDWTMLDRLRDGTAGGIGELLRLQGRAPE